MAERRTFAFDVAAPVQGSPSAQGGYRGSNIVGGGTVTGNPGTFQSSGGFGEALGDFFEGIMAPQIKAAQEAKFVQGMTDQMYAEAGHEIRSGNGLLTKIFGPTDYERGAQFYESQTIANNAVAAWNAREDELKRMPKEQVAKEWAGMVKGLATGDNILDQQVQSSMVQQIGPMLTSVAKASYKYGQERINDSQIESGRSGAAALQATMQSFYETDDPDEAASQGALVAVDTFAQSRIQLEGQDDDSYRKSMYQQFRQIVRDGNGYAATALLHRGYLDTILDDQQRIRAEDEYNRMASSTNRKAAQTYIADIDKLYYDLENGRVNGAQAGQRMEAINRKVKRLTGFDADVFDLTDKTNAAKSVWANLHAALNREEDKADAIQLEEQRQVHAKELELYKAGLKASMAETAWASANPGGALASGAIDDGARDAVGYKAFVNSDFAGWAKALKTGWNVPSTVTNLVQNTIASAVNTSGYSPEFENLHKKFEGFMEADPVAAKAIFGNQYAAMLNYRKQLTTSTPAVAFATAFGSDKQYGVGGGEIVKANKKIKEWVADQQPGRITRMLTGTYALNTSARNAMANLLAREVAQDSKFLGGDLTEEVARKTALERSIISGAYEQVGPLGWTNREGTKPLWKVMGMQQEEGNKVALNLIDQRLKDAGYAEGAFGDEYQITRASYNGKPHLIVIPVVNGVSKTSSPVVISAQSFIDAGKTYRAGKVEAPNIKQKPKRPGLLGLGGPGGDFITGN